MYSIISFIFIFEIFKDAEKKLLESFHGGTVVKINILDSLWFKVQTYTEFVLKITHC